MHEVVTDRNNLANDEMKTRCDMHCNSYEFKESEKVCLHCRIRIQKYRNRKNRIRLSHVWMIWNSTYFWKPIESYSFREMETWLRWWSDLSIETRRGTVRMALRKQIWCNKLSIFASMITFLITITPFTVETVSVIATMRLLR